MGNLFIHKCLSCSDNIPGPELDPEDPGEIKQTMSLSFWNLQAFWNHVGNVSREPTSLQAIMKPADWPELPVSIKAKCSLRTT